MAVKVGINGFGRIGRNVFRAALNNPEVEVVAVNDLTDANMLAHLLQYDSVHGKLDAKVSVDGSNLVVNGQTIQVTAERDPSKLSWGEQGVEIEEKIPAIVRVLTNCKVGIYRIHVDEPSLEDIFIDSSEERVVS